MRCTVLFFAHLAEVTGSRQIVIDLPEEATVADALKSLERTHRLASWRNQLGVAVNERFQPPSARLRDGDTLALIPPVSGG